MKNPIRCQKKVRCASPRNFLNETDSDVKGKRWENNQSPYGSPFEPRFRPSGWLRNV